MTSSMILDTIQNWVDGRNRLPKKSIMVTSRQYFPDFVSATKGLDDVAYISISATKDMCEIKYDGDYSECDHLLDSSDIVLNLEFDDLTEDEKVTKPSGEPGICKTITESQAKEILDFVESNLGKHLIIHCRAGRSRSAGVARAIFDLFPEVYEENFYNDVNPVTTPNMEVVRKIKRAYIYRLGIWK